MISGRLKKARYVLSGLSEALLDGQSIGKKFENKSIGYRYNHIIVSGNNK